MSQAVVHNGVAYLSGQVAMDLPGAPVADQARAIFARIDSLLDRVGTDRSKLLSA
nr:Rid family hydrolase [Sphingomonas bacterium]